MPEMYLQSYTPNSMVIDTLERQINVDKQEIWRKSSILRILKELYHMVKLVKAANWDAENFYGAFNKIMEDSHKCPVCGVVFTEGQTHKVDCQLLKALRYHNMRLANIDYPEVVLGETNHVPSQDL